MIGIFFIPVLIVMNEIGGTELAILIYFTNCAANTGMSVISVLIWLQDEEETRGLGLGDPLFQLLMSNKYIKWFSPAVYTDRLVSPGQLVALVICRSRESRVRLIYSWYQTTRDVVKVLLHDGGAPNLFSGNPLAYLPGPLVQIFQPRDARGTFFA